MAFVVTPSAMDRPEFNPIAVLCVPVVLLFNELTPTAVLLAPVVLFCNEINPTAVFCMPVVIRPPADVPIARLLEAVFALISKAVADELVRPIINGEDTNVIERIETTMVPLKSEVGVMVNPVVVVAVGPKAPVTEIPASDCPPNARVNEPVVLPVTVYAI